MATTRGTLRSRLSTAWRLALVASLATHVSCLGKPPLFGYTQVLDDPPPPVSGGTLLALRDGRTLVATDPDRDAVYLVDASTRPPSLRATLSLDAHDEPGRAVEDGAGRVHVVLRRGGAVATLDPVAGAWVGRRSVCGTPRGIAFDAGSDALHVACASGELVTLPAAGAGPARAVRLDDDLRDVVVDNGRLLVSRFRSAEVLVVSPSTGAVTGRLSPAPYAVDVTVRNAVMNTETTRRKEYSASVAWRMIPLAGGGALVAHQRAQDTVVLAPGGSVSGYYGRNGESCQGSACPVVLATLSRVQASQGGGPLAPHPHVAGATLPVDVAAEPGGRRYALVAAGNTLLSTEPKVYYVDACDYGGAREGADCRASVSLREPVQPPGQAIAAAFVPDGRLVVQTRDPAALFFPGDTPRTSVTLTLSEVNRHDTGHEVFHAETGGGIACASCHPEAGEDGHVWTFLSGQRVRSQSLRGGVLATAPFHWDGALPSMTQIMSSVFVTRMSGPRLDDAHVYALGRWLDAQPVPAAPRDVDPAAVARGEALFRDVNVGCASCHAGGQGTTSRNEDVGTGGAFQVPSLKGLRWRAPYMHDGCAATLRERFDPDCGGRNHGRVEGLTAGQLDDLVAYMRTL